MLPVVRLSVPTWGLSTLWVTAQPGLPYMAVEVSSESAGGSCQASGGLAPWGLCRITSVMFYQPKPVARPTRFRAGLGNTLVLEGEEPATSRGSAVPLPPALAERRPVDSPPFQNNRPCPVPSALVGCRFQQSLDLPRALPLSSFSICLTAALRMSRPGGQNAGFLSFHPVC